MANTLNQNITTALGLDSLTPEKQAEVLLKISQAVYQAVLIRVMDNMDDKTRDEFEILLEEKADDGDVIFAFLQEKVSNLDEVVREEVAKFKDESLDVIMNLEQ